MKIKYFKITKFNVVFNLKRIENESLETPRKVLWMEFNVPSCDNKKWQKESVKQKRKKKLFSTLSRIIVG